MAVAEDGHAVVAGGFEGEVQVWPVPSDERSEPDGIGYHGKSIYFADSFTANGTTIVVPGDKDGRINALASERICARSRCSRARWGSSRGRAPR